MTGLAFAVVAFYAVSLAAWLANKTVLSRKAAAELQAQVALLKREQVSKTLVEQQLDEMKTRIAKLEFRKVA